MPTAENLSNDSVRQPVDAIFPNRKALLLGWTPLAIVILLASLDVSLPTGLSDVAFAIAILAACHQTLLFLRYVNAGGREPFLGTRGASVWSMPGFCAWILHTLGAPLLLGALTPFVICLLVGIVVQIWYSGK